MKELEKKFKDLEKKFKKLKLENEKYKQKLEIEKNKKKLEIEKYKQKLEIEKNKHKKIKKGGNYLYAQYSDILSTNMNINPINTEVDNEMQYAPSSFIAS